MHYLNQSCVIAKYKHVLLRVGGVESLKNSHRFIYFVFLPFFYGILRNTNNTTCLVVVDRIQGMLGIWLDRCDHGNMLSWCIIITVDLVAILKVKLILIFLNQFIDQDQYLRSSVIRSTWGRYSLEIDQL